MIIKGQKAKVVDVHAHCYFQKALDFMGDGGASVLPTVKGVPQHFLQQPDPLQERLAAMDVDGVDYSVLYPTVAGRAGEGFATLTDPELELACCEAYNDFLVEEWASVSPRFIPQCIVPMAGEAAGKGH